MFTKNKIIEEFKNRNIDAILFMDHRLIFYVKDEATKKSINDLMLQIKPIIMLILIGHSDDIVSKGLAIVILPFEKPKSFWERIKIKIKLLIN
jgi:hypothetical protein